MVLIESYSLAIALCVLAMLCWGSWANTQKLAQKTWRFELFYWDLAVGLLLGATLSALTVGSLGCAGRPFFTDLQQADLNSIFYAMAGGVLWNLGNWMLVAAIAIAGMSVAFPIGGGVAWVLGILFNHILAALDPDKRDTSNPYLLFVGVIVIIFAIYLSMQAYRRLASRTEKPTVKGIVLSLAAGLLIAFFYGFVVKSLDSEFVIGGTGVLTPYTAVFFFGVGVFISTFFINPYFMRHPVQGEPCTMTQYFSGSAVSHLTGVIGGLIWMLGMVVSFMAVSAVVSTAAETASPAISPAISYALSNAAPVVAILWGVLVWKEFREAPAGTNKLLAIMFVSYLIGLAVITYSNIPRADA